MTQKRKGKCQQYGVGGEVDLWVAHGVSGETEGELGQGVQREQLAL